MLAIEHIVTECSINLSLPASVVFGHDTRPSCPALVQALRDGLATFATHEIEAGLVTTPQLHYLVRCYNTQGTLDDYGVPTVQGYYDKLAKAYKTLSVSLPLDLSW